MVSPGLAFAVLLNGLVLVIVVMLGIRFRSELASFFTTGAGVSSETWYRQTRELATEVQRAADQDGPMPESDEVQRTLSPLVGRLDGQLRRAPSGVDDDVYRLLHRLSNQCRRIAMERADTLSIKRGEYIEDELQSLGETAERLAREADANR